MDIYLLGAIASIITCTIVSLLVVLGLLLIVYYLQTNKEKIKLWLKIRKEFKKCGKK